MYVLCSLRSDISSDSETNIGLDICVHVIHMRTPCGSQNTRLSMKWNSADKTPISPTHKWVTWMALSHRQLASSLFSLTPSPSLVVTFTYSPRLQILVSLIFLHYNVLDTISLNAFLGLICVASPSLRLRRTSSWSL